MGFQGDKAMLHGVTSLTLGQGAMRPRGKVFPESPLGSQCPGIPVHNHTTGTVHPGMAKAQPFARRAGHVGVMGGVPRPAHARLWDGTGGAKGRVACHQWCRAGSPETLNLKLTFHVLMKTYISR